MGASRLWFQFGGIDSNGTLYGDTWLYSFNIKLWTRIFTGDDASRTTPDARAFATAVFIAGGTPTVLLYGGSCSPYTADVGPGGGNTCDSKVWELRFDADAQIYRWSKIINLARDSSGLITEPPTRTLHTATALFTTMYVYGGTSGLANGVDAINREFDGTDSYWKVCVGQPGSHCGRFKHLNFFLLAYLHDSYYTFCFRFAFIIPPHLEPNTQRNKQTNKQNTYEHNRRSGRSITAPSLPNGRSSLSEPSIKEAAAAHRPTSTFPIGTVTQWRSIGTNPPPDRTSSSTEGSPITRPFSRTGSRTMSSPKNGVTTP